MKTPQVPALPGMTPLGFKTPVQIARAAKRKAKADNALIEKAYYATCRGIPINIMDIGKVFARGKEILEHCPGDFDTLCKGICAYVETIRVPE